MCAINCSGGCPECSPEDHHPYGWERGKPFPPEEVLDPPVQREGLWVGLCVYCGGSLGGPYQEDLYHEECDKKAETGYFDRLLDLTEPHGKTS